MRTHVANDGVGPSSTNIMNQPGGHTFAFGGAVTVHELPAHEKAGKMVRWPIELPWVLETAPRSETRSEPPELEVMVKGTVWP